MESSFYVSLNCNLKYFKASLKKTNDLDSNRVFYDIKILMLCFKYNADIYFFLLKSTKRVFRTNVAMSIALECYRRLKASDTLFV